MSYIDVRYLALVKEMNPEYFQTLTSFKYLGGLANGMEIRSGARPPSPVHFHHIDSTKSILALQELQNEVGALLEFRDVVMEAFPQLRGKLGSRGRWEPGVRVRKKLRDCEVTTTGEPRSRSNSRSKGSSTTTVQDSGFCTQESKKTSDQEVEDELWNLLEVIHERGTRLRLEVESLQERYGSRGRSRSLEDTGRPENPHLRQLRRDKHLLIERVTEMEAENLANLARTNQLLAEMGASGGLVPLRPLDPVSRRLLGPPASLSLDDLRDDRLPQSPPRPLGTLDGILTTPRQRIPCPKGITPDKNKTAAILSETNIPELQRHLLTTTHEVQIVHHKLDKVVKSKMNLSQQLDKVKEENEDLKFQLEEKSIELEGTRARVRLLERLQAAKLEEHCSSTESAHHEAGADKSSSSSGRPRRSKIPLKAAAPRPPGPASTGSSAGSRSLARSVGPSLKPQRPPSRNPSTPSRTPHSEPDKKGYRNGSCSMDSLETLELDRSMGESQSNRLWCRAASQAGLLFFDSIEGHHKPRLVLRQSDDSLDSTKDLV